VGLKIKFKVMKLEWLLIRPVHNTKTIVQQDSVKALHDNSNTLKKKTRFPVIARGRQGSPTKVTQ